MQSLPVSDHRKLLLVRELFAQLSAFAATSSAENLG
jgi:hypothetical protein